ncbi:helix-turn-helix domain-containing protein [Parasphingorhabdus halotolerans]|uniref:AraC family transcriptional regulator n=1 Tax=Parasphingorhabdus halotolerans TaxID=2725558 RepID=A0A6H2DNH4_9SPHN|nr:helix-turn-helix domain-containing protein [Parasphingorhabdus halotolerans]QJB69904.1 AraC family transcriptional regulator [Parasphingorhabdus halotolerans]
MIPREMLSFVRFLPQFSKGRLTHPLTTLHCRHDAYKKANCKAVVFLNALVGVSAITLLVVMAIVAVMYIRPARAWPYLILASLTTASLFLSLSAPALEVPALLTLIAGFANVPHLYFVWIFALSVFQSGFSLQAWHLAIGGIYTFPIFWFRAFQFDLTGAPPYALSIGVSIGSALLVMHVASVIIRESGADLVEARKRTRAFFVTALILTTILTAIVDLYLIAAWPEYAQLIKAACIWPAVFAAAIWLVRSSKDDFVLVRAVIDFSNAEDQTSSKDRALLTALQCKILKERIYLNPDLTVSTLAKDLGVNSHRLRALINTSLGYENFNQFINSFRVEAIGRRLTDEKHDHLPILTIALEGGFRSLAPFNKAFKAQFGTTPSDFRKRRQVSLATIRATPNRLQG